MRADRNLRAAARRYAEMMRIYNTQCQSNNEEALKRVDLAALALQRAARVYSRRASRIDTAYGRHYPTVPRAPRKAKSNG